MHGRLSPAPHPALLAATGAALVRPIAVVFAAILLIPLDLFAVPVGSVGVTATEGLFALAGLGWAVRRCLVEGPSPLARTPLDAPVVLLLLSIVPGLAIAVDLAAQARFLLEAFTRLRSWHFVDVAIWYALGDTSTDASDLVGNFGLLHADGSPKPSLYSFRWAAATLHASP